MIKLNVIFANNQIELMFFLIVLSGFFALSTYVFTRGFQALPPSVAIKIIYSILFIAGFLSFFSRMYFGDKIEERYAVPMSDIGFTFIIALVYFAIIVFVIDLFRVANYFFHIFPNIITENWSLSKQIALVVSLVTVVILLIIGNRNFNNPQVTKYELYTEKRLPEGALKIVLASDLHLSSYINGKHLRQYVDLINAQNPDLIMLAGDIADRDVRPLVEHSMEVELARLNARYGVFAITGNHEFYGGDRDHIYQIIRSSGINLLIDSTHESPYGFIIIGRDDLTNSKRAPLDLLIRGVDEKLPLILLDHQPKNLDDAVNNKVDLQLSGHTHKGQFWPGNLIVSSMFELAYGHKKKSETDFIVTSGLGLWGPKYRIGTKSEIVVIDWKELPASSGPTSAESSATEPAKATSAESSATSESSSEPTGPATSTSGE